MNERAPGAKKDNWDRELEGGLPDSRTRAFRETLYIGSMALEVCYCAHCGRKGGAVTRDWAEHVFYLCDPCSQLPLVVAELAQHNIIEMPESVVGEPHVTT